MKKPKQSNVEKAADINDFGRNSFVTHTTGLVERVETMEVICEADCPACGEIVEFRKLGWTICPHCKSIRALLTIEKWEPIEDENEDHNT